MADARPSRLGTRPGVAGAGTLTRVVLDYQETMKRLVPTLEAPGDWDPLARFVAVGAFERIGTFLEVQNWQQYTEMLTHWAAAVDSFETTVRRMTEVGRLVYFEIEERHRAGAHLNVVNSMTVFAFDDDDKIRHLDVYLQQER
ncbi:MAG: hypothetical protein ACLPVF_15270 [Acidimicrobiales bacterium]